MIGIDYKPDSLRIGEIVVLGPPEVEKGEFISAICEEVDKNDDIVLGRLQVNDQLILHIYGLDVGADVNNFAWDLVAQKMIGYIVLYNWYDANSLERAKSLVDHLHSEWEAPCIIAADVGETEYPIAKKIFKRGISLSPNTQFTFYRIVDPASVRRIFLTLLDTIIERM